MLYQSVVCLCVTHIELGPTLSKGRGYPDGCFAHSRPKITIKSRREVEENPFVTQQLQLLVGYLVAVLDGIGTGVNRGLYRRLVDRMHRDFQMRPMRLFNNRSQLSDCQIFVRCHLDYIDVLKLIPPHCLPRAVRPFNQEELLLKDGIGKGRIEILKVRTACDEFAS